MPKVTTQWLPTLVPEMTYNVLSGTLNLHYYYQSGLEPVTCERDTKA